MKKHYVVTGVESGSFSRAPLKTWLRENPGILPGVEIGAQTSHQLRGKLQTLGWRLELTEGEAILLPPGFSDELALPELVASAASEPSASDTDDEVEELAFELEHQLRDFIVANLPSINVAGRKLSLFKDTQGRNGREYPTGVGFIDILAQDSDGNFCVFELKRGRTSDHTVGQLLRYMGWLRAKYPEVAAISGVVVAKEITENLRYAVSVVPNVSAFEYDISFSLKPTAQSPHLQKPHSQP